MSTTKIFCDEKDCNNFIIVNNYKCKDHRIAEILGEDMFKEVTAQELIDGN